jgi:hypothetical protein
VIAALGQLLAGALEILVEPVAAIISGFQEQRTPQPREYFRARKRLEVSAYIRGVAGDSFPCPIPRAMMVRIAEEHLAPSGDILATAHSEGHGALVPSAYRVNAQRRGYLLKIPQAMLRKSFKHISVAI